ncbi:MAG: class I SAM-dependent methyltransferase [Ignavibacteria bacterium]|nr:class I SAM-dependent methyltransferase [Ignavibacteria bacterium]
MGTSNWQNISYNIELVKKLDPKSILDIGVGFGRWGILFREFLEIWGERNYSGKWKRTIDGVEIFPGYIKDYHKYFYDNIFIENAIGFIKRTDKKYDLINCGDVIEHFEKKDAEEFINICLQKSKSVLINIPTGSNWQQGVINNNQNERHLSEWSIPDFTKYSNHLIREFKDIELRAYIVVLLSKDKIDLNITYGKYFGLKNILKNKLGLGSLVKIIESRND